MQVIFFILFVPYTRTRVSEEIKSAKILGFGEHFTPNSCELQYKSLLEGYRLGFPDNSIQIKVPRVLTEAQKRQWILATTVAGTKTRLKFGVLWMINI